MKASTNQRQPNTSYKINFTALFTWIGVLAFTGVFWCSIGFALQQDYVPRTIAKLQKKEQRFIDNHKGLQKKINGISNLVS